MSAFPIFSLFVSLALLSLLPLLSLLSLLSAMASRAQQQRQRSGSVVTATTNSPTSSYSSPRPLSPGGSVLVSVAQTADIGALAALRVRAFRSYLPLSGLRRVRRHHERRCRRVLHLAAASGKLSHCGLVRNEAGRPLAAIQLQLLGDTPDLFLSSLLWRESSAVEAYVEWIAVHPSCRGMGLGAALLQWAKDTAAYSGASRLALHVFQANRAAVALYRKQGFVPVRPPEGDSLKQKCAVWCCLGGRHIHEYYMVVDLQPQLTQVRRSRTASIKSQNDRIEVRVLEEQVKDGRTVEEMAVLAPQPVDRSLVERRVGPEELMNSDVRAVKVDSAAAQQLMTESGRHRVGNVVIDDLDARIASGRHRGGTVILGEGVVETHAVPTVTNAGALVSGRRPEFVKDYVPAAAAQPGTVPLDSARVSRHAAVAPPRNREVLDKDAPAVNPSWIHVDVDASSSPSAHESQPHSVRLQGSVVEMSPVSPAYGVQSESTQRMGRGVDRDIQPVDVSQRTSGRPVPLTNLDGVDDDERQRPRIAVAQEDVLATSASPTIVSAGAVADQRRRVDLLQQQLLLEERQGSASATYGAGNAGNGAAQLTPAATTLTSTPGSQAEPVQYYAEGVVIHAQPAHISSGNSAHDVTDTALAPAEGSRLQRRVAVEQGLEPTSSIQEGGTIVMSHAPLSPTAVGSANVLRALNQTSKSNQPAENKGLYDERMKSGGSVEQSATDRGLARGVPADMTDSATGSTSKRVSHI